MNEHEPHMDDEDFAALHTIIFGELANEEDHELLQSLGYGLVNQYGDKEVWGHYGYQVESGSVVFGVAEAVNNPELGVCTTFKILDRYRFEDDEENVLVEVTFGGQDQVIGSYIKNSSLSEKVLDKVAGILMDIAHENKLSPSIVDLSGYILQMADSDFIDPNYAWQVASNDSTTTRSAAGILREFANNFIDVRVEETEFSVSDNESATTIRTHSYIGQFEDGFEDTILPSLEIIHQNRSEFEEYRYGLFPDGEIEYIELDPRHEDKADIRTSSESIEKEQEIDTEVAEVMEDTPLYTLSKQAHTRLMRVLLDISLYYEE